MFSLLFAAAYKNVELQKLSWKLVKTKSKRCCSLCDVTNGSSPHWRKEEWNLEKMVFLDGPGWTCLKTLSRAPEVTHLRRLHLKREPLAPLPVNSNQLLGCLQADIISQFGFKAPRLCLFFSSASSSEEIRSRVASGAKAKW